MKLEKTLEEMTNKVNTWNYEVSSWSMNMMGHKTKLKIILGFFLCGLAFNLIGWVVVSNILYLMVLLQVLGLIYSYVVDMVNGRRKKRI